MSDLIQKVTVPEGSKGIWKVEKFEVEERLSFIYGSRAPRPGIYTRLLRSNEVIMSDTDAEMRDHIFPVMEAKGHVLINGLGIGMVLQACLRKDSVTRATVVEISQDVIDLVGPHYSADERVEIICADAYEYRPPKGARYGMVWHDIWDGICADNLEGMKRLHRKYGRLADWQGSWARYECERLRAESKREKYWFLR